MNSYLSRYWYLLPTFFLFLISQSLIGQDDPDIDLDAVIYNLESMLDSNSPEPVKSFLTQYMGIQDIEDGNAVFQNTLNIREELRGLRDDISVELVEGGIMMIFAGPNIEKQLLVALDTDSGMITNMEIQKAQEPLILTSENLEKVFDTLEMNGMAGVIYIVKNGNQVIRRPFGMANKALSYPNKLNTIFGTGSRPIDYTVAAIYLLDQRGLLDIDDKISEHFDNVPDDKKNLTIKHLMTGQSGFPDFFHMRDNDELPERPWGYENCYLIAESFDEYMNKLDAASES